MRKISLLVFFMAIALFSKAQLTGPKAIPGDYATIAAAITDLNAQGVGAGGVTFNVAAGHTETLAGKQTITATGTAANPIIFQKSGAGANPVITSYTGTVATPSVIADGMIVLAGSDYITFDGINLQEAAGNTTTTTVMEYGFGLFLASATNGCQNNTIQNCTITLNRLQNTAWTAPGHNGSVGIAISNALHTATGAVTLTAASGSNSFNKFYSNTIQNCNVGIAFVGFAAPSPFTLGDTNNDVGGTSGTTGNTIKNFGGAAAATNPAHGIFANNQWGFNCSYNTINNNDGAGVNHVSTLRGIFLNVSSTSASVNCNNNNITIHGGATTSQVSFIENSFGSTAAGNTVNINNNTCTGDYLTATSGSFFGIYNTATPATLNMQNNTVNNVVYSDGALTGSGTVYLIYSTASSATTTKNITGNTVNNINRTGTTGGTTIGIYVSSGTTGMGVNITGNTVSNMAIDGAGTASILYGIQASTGTINISNNNVNNLQCLKTTGTGALYGIYDISSPVNETYNNNDVHALIHNGTGIVYGIYANTTTGTRTTMGNLVYNLFTTGTTIAGIHMASSSPNVYKNKVYDIESTSSGAPTVSGILLTSTATSGTANIYNNLVGDLKAPNAVTTTAPSVRGINIVGTSTTSNFNFSYNSVYLNASSSGANFGTAALYATVSATATSGALTLRNNILVNQSTPAGTGFTVAYQRSGTALNNYTSASNNNLFYAGAPSATNLIFYDGTNSDQTIGAFKARVTPGESASVSESPNFLSTSGSSADFLHIDPTIATQIESGGIPVGGITDDYDGDTRNVTTPDMGADELNGIGADLNAPTIIYTPLTFTCGTGNRTLTATITDASGVPTSGAGLPVLYWRINAGSWNAATATHAGGNNYDFSFGSGVVSGDVVQYYVVAQDNAGTPNIGAFPATGAAGFTANPPAASTPPTTPSSYNVTTALNGTYTVGAAGTYATLTAAIAAYNASCLTGAVVFELIDATYSGSETFPININRNPDASAVNTLTIRPAAGNAVNISGTSGAAVSALIRLNGARYITFDGINSGGTSMLIENTSVTTGTAVFWLSSNGTGQGASNNTIQNTSIRAGVGQDTATSVTYGVVIAGSTLSATLTSVTAGDDNDNNTIQDNTFTRARYGVYTRGGSATNPNTGTVITRNTFGPNTFGTDQIGRAGVVTREEDGIQITQNTFRYIGGAFANTTGGADRVAIAVTTDATWTNSTTPPTAVMVRNAVITRNTITDVVDERTFTAAGIVLSAADGANPTNNLVANNMISGLRANGTSSDQTVGIGIGTGNTDKIVYNSIHLFGDTDPNASATAPTQTHAGINITSTSVVNLLLRNNIVVVNLSSSSAPTIRSACIGIPTGYSWGTGNANYNNFYAPPANTVAHTGAVGGTSGTFYLSLANWQTAVSQDANSTAASPVFTSATDLHLVTNANGALNNTGTPVAGVTNDFDNNLRDAATPDMGADEFSAPVVVDISSVSLQAPVVKVCYSNAETVTMRILNNSGGAHDFAVNPATVTVNVTGAVTTTLNATLNTGTLAAGATLDVNMSSTLNMSTAGVYTFNGYVVVTGDVNNSNDTLNPAVNRTVTALNAGTISANPGAFCVTPGIPTLTRTGGGGIGNIQWQESTVSGTGPWTNVGTNSNTYTPGAAITGTTYYRAEVTCNGNTAYSNVDTVELFNPQLLSTTPGSRCGIGTVTLAGTASPGDSVYWYAGPTGGSPLGIGNTFITPVINTTTTYYAAAGSAGGGSESAGKPIYTSTLNTSGNAWGLVFNVANQGITLQSVKVYSVGATAGVISVQLTDNAGTVLATAGPFNYPAGSVASPVAVTLPLGFSIPVGTGYRLLSASMSGGALIRETSGNTFPYNSSSNNVSVTSGYISGTSTTYYWFYDWVVSAGCETPRTAVTATVTPSPVLTTVADATICNNEGKMLNVTSTLGDFNTYTWTPQAGLFTDNTYSTPYTGQNLSTVYVKTTTGGLTNYVVTGTQTGGSLCSNTDTVAITVMPATTISATPANICFSDSSKLSLVPATGYGAGSIQWQQSATGGAGTYTNISGQTGTSYTTPIINTATWYGVVLKDGAGNTCLLNPTYQLTVSTPSITGTTPGSRCGPGSVNLGATASGAGTVRWYNAPTGGSLVGSGSSFSTPSISATTTFYAASAEGLTIQKVGADSITSFPNSGTNSSFTAGMLFDVIGSPAKITSVNIYPTTAIGTRFQIVVRSGGASGTVIATYQDTTTVTGTVATPAVQTVPVNFNIPAGTNYAMTFFNGTLQAPLSGTAVYPGALRNNPATGATFPYTIPGKISITNGSLAGVWYYFYNWKVETGCESPRSAVVATVNNAPLSIVNPDTLYISCDSARLSVPGASDIKITEVTLQRNGVGQTTAYPAFATGEDLIEISNISSSPVDVSGYTFADYTNNSGTAVHPYTIPAATVIPANGVLILHLGTGTDDAPNRYFNTGGTSNNWLANSQAGFVLKDVSGKVVDVVGCGGSATGSYTFAPALGISADDWSSFAPNVTGFAGVTRRVTMDNNTGGDWLRSDSISNVQTIGAYNAGLAYPVYLWTPATGLYTDAALTIPYTNQNLATVYAKPGSTTTYTLQGSSNGCTASSNILVNVLTPGTVEWTGAVNTDWTNTGNWKCGLVPGINSNVHISSGKPNYPVLTLNVEIRSLTLTSGATVTVGTGFDLKLNGN